MRDFVLLLNMNIFECVSKVFSIKLRKIFCFLVGEGVVVEGFIEDMLFFEGDEGDDVLKMEEVD